MGNKLVVACVATVLASKEFYQTPEAFIHDTINAWNILIRKLVWVPVIRPGIRLETASRWIYRKAGYEKRNVMATRGDKTELIQHLKSAPCSKMICYDA
jgi:hypothetical protein